MPSLRNFLSVSNLNLLCCHLLPVLLTLDIKNKLFSSDLQHRLVYLRIYVSFSQPFLSQRADFKQFFFIRHSSCSLLGDVSDCSCPGAIPSPGPRGSSHLAGPACCWSRPFRIRTRCAALPLSPSCLFAIIEVISENSKQHPLQTARPLLWYLCVDSERLPPLGPV